MSYFRFLRWLFNLNLLIFFLLLIFVVIPQVAFKPHDYESWVTANDSRIDWNTSEICSDNYSITVDKSDVLELILDFLQGTGWMEKTLLFYGYYSDRRLAIGTWHDHTYKYSLPLAYILVTFAFFGISLILMVKNTAGAFRSRLVESSNKYGNTIFGGWDYAQNDGRLSARKHNSLYNELLTHLHEDRHSARRANRRPRDKCRLFTVRLCINLFVIGVLGACGYGIYYATEESLKFKERPDFESKNNFVKLLMEYVPSLSITVLNIVIPMLFSKVVLGEELSPATEIQLTLTRTVFLRLASLAVLLGTVYSQVTCSTKDFCEVGVLPNCPELRCWETYVGQQIYKLVILDFFVMIGKVFLMDFPRRIGAFFSPLIPGMCVVDSFVVFYLKKLTCMYNHVPPARQFRASRTHEFFMGILLAAFVMCCVVIGYIIWRIPPSKGCGPFRIYTSMFGVLAYTVASWPKVVRQIIWFLGSASVVGPVVILLILIIYYCSAVSQARSDRVESMREQLVLERKDKKFLMSRVKEKPQTRTRHQNWAY